MGGLLSPRGRVRAGSIVAALALAAGFSQTGGTGRFGVNAVLA